MKIFDPHCVACVAVSLNDSVSSSYRNAFAGESERGKKQRVFAPKNKIHFVSKLIIFKMEQVQSHTGESLGQPRSNVFQLMN